MDWGFKGAQSAGPGNPKSSPLHFVNLSNATQPNHCNRFLSAPGLPAASFQDTYANGSLAAVAAASGVAPENITFAAAADKLSFEAPKAGGGRKLLQDAAAAAAPAPAGPVDSTLVTYTLSTRDPTGARRGCVCALLPSLLDWCLLHV